MHNIAIIGCGVIGLSTATVIQNEFKKSAKITIFAENVTPNTTSDVAAGLWGPYNLENVTRTKLEQVSFCFTARNSQIICYSQWGKSTHDYFLQLWKNGFADDAGITIQLAKRFSETENFISQHPRIIFGTEPMSPKELKHYSKAHNKNYKSGCTFVTFTCELSKFLPFLQKNFVDNGGIINKKKICNVGELKHYDLVVNCTGLGSEDLLKDDKMIAIRGQVARVTAPWQFHVVLSSLGYIIPNCNNVVLGGTHQVNNRNNNVSESDAQSILDRSSILVPALKNAPILYHKVGLRPARSHLRLQVENFYVGHKCLTVVHNYGHGGGGVTLSFGCALEVLYLVKTSLNL